MVIKNAKCSQLFALFAEKKRLFLSNRLVKKRSIESVLSPPYLATGKSLIVETYPGLRAWEVFLLPGKGGG